MIVAFPFAFNGLETEKEISLANLFIRSIRKVSPAVRLVQMVDERTAILKGTDGYARLKGEYQFGEWLFESLIHFPAEQFLRLDYDIIMREDVSDVFQYDFDIAIAKEGRGVMNNGVVFVKNRDFYKASLDFYKTTTMDNWQDIQKAMQMAIETNDFLIHRLEQPVYNYYPGRDGEPYPEDAKILHFKGSRKKRMIAELTQQFAVEDGLFTGTFHKRAAA